MNIRIEQNNVFDLMILQPTNSEELEAFTQFDALQDDLKAEMKCNPDITFQQLIVRKEKL